MCCKDCCPCCPAGCREAWNFSLTHRHPKLFVTAQCPSLPQAVFVIYRALWSIFFLVYLVLSIRDSPGDYYIYFTHWGFVLVTLTSLWQFGTACWAAWSQLSGEEILEMRWFLKIQWVLYNASASTCLIVSIIYWSLLYEVSFGIDHINICIHGMNSVYILVDIFVSGTPIRLAHFFHGAIFFVLYIIFNIPWTLVMDKHVYPVLAWNTDIGLSILSTFCIAIAAPIVLFLVVYILYRLRLAMCNCCSQRPRGTIEPTTTGPKEEHHVSFQY